MTSKLHQFNIPLNKLICPICNEQRGLGITHTTNPKTKEISGALLSLQCWGCYAQQENVLIVSFIEGI